jgi:HEAT repeat protein
MAQETNQALDKAFDALKTYEWGTDIALLEPIDNAITASHGKPAARKEIEARLAPVLKSGAPWAAKDFVCRKLALIGTAQSVPALAELLANKDLGHMARYALERIPGPEAGKALREAISKAAGRNRLGIIASVGVRRDSAGAGRLAALLNGPDEQAAAAAAIALGEIGTPEAAKALDGYRRRAPKEHRNVAADACLVCAGAS